MTSRKKKSELENLCKVYGINLQDNVKYRKKDLVYKLGQKSLELGKRKNSWALNAR